MDGSRSMSPILGRSARTLGKREARRKVTPLLATEQQCDMTINSKISITSQNSRLKPKEKNWL